MIPDGEWNRPAPGLKAKTVAPPLPGFGESRSCIANAGFHGRKDVESMRRRKTTAKQRDSMVLRRKYCSPRTVLAPNRTSANPSDSPTQATPLRSVGSTRQPPPPAATNTVCINIAQANKAITAETMASGIFRVREVKARMGKVKDNSIDDAQI